MIFQGNYAGSCHNLSVVLSSLAQLVNETGEPRLSYIASASTNHRAALKRGGNPPWVHPSYAPCDWWREGVLVERAPGNVKRQNGVLPRTSRQDPAHLFTARPASQEHQSPARDTNDYHVPQRNCRNP